MRQLPLLLLYFLVVFFSCQSPAPAPQAVENAVTDTLYKKVTQLPVQESLSYLDSIRKALHGPAHLEIRFRAYCKSAIINAVLREDLSSAQSMMDSARNLLESSGRYDLQATYDLYYAMLHQYDNDAALVLMQQVMPHIDKLIHQDKLLALGGYAVMHNTNGNLRLSVAYNLQYLKENRNGKFRREIYDENTVLINLHLNYLNLGDTAQAMKYLKEAQELVATYPDIQNTNDTYLTLGKYYIDKKEIDTALFFLKEYKRALQEENPEYAIAKPYLYFAEAAFADQKYNLANKLIDSAFFYLNDNLSKDSSSVDQYFIRELYNYRYQIKDAVADIPESFAALKAVQKLDGVIHGQEKSDQILQFEKRITAAKAEKQLAEKERRLSDQRSLSNLMLAVFLLIVSVAIILFLIWRRKKQKEAHQMHVMLQAAKLREAQLSLQAESQERQRIARELHDELGSTLTRIRMAVRVIAKDGSAKQSPALRILEDNSTMLLKQANDIVWSLNDANDNLKSLFAYMHTFCSGFLSEMGIKYRYRADDIPDRPMEGYKRRLIYQSVKEMVNNAVKHSQCTALTLDISVMDSTVHLSIKDNGVGIPMAASGNNGNGLANIRCNIEALDGFMHMESDKKGTIYTIRIPLLDL